MTLEETVPLMLSEDFKDRLRAEYLQLCIRIESLDRWRQNLTKKLVAQLDMGAPLEEINNTRQELGDSEYQRRMMQAYRNALRQRMARLDVSTRVSR